MSESKHPLSDEVIKGNEIAWTNCGISCYNTNFGMVEVDEKTSRFVSCCVELGRNQGNTPMQVKIFDNEFQISCDYLGAISSELCSPNYNYSCNKSIKSIEITEVLQMLQQDNNCSVAAIIAKKELVKLMKVKLHFTADNEKELKELFRIWRNPILKRDLVIKIPIIKRTPIITLT